MTDKNLLIKIIKARGSCALGNDITGKDCVNCFHKLFCQQCIRVDNIFKNNKYNAVLNYYIKHYGELDLVEKLL